jgi:hypothetical protein
LEDSGSQNGDKKLGKWHMCGIQSQEIARGWAIFVGSSIRGHTKVAMGSNGVDLDKARENELGNLLQLHYKKGILSCN